MKKLFSSLLVASILVTSLTGCMGNSAKELNMPKQELATASTAKKLMVALGVPHDYIKDGDRPELAQFEQPAQVDKIGSNLGLITFASTLSITGAMIGNDAGNSSYERTKWKKELQYPIIFSFHDKSEDVSSENHIFYKVFKENVNSLGYYVKDNFSYNFYKTNNNEDIMRFLASSYDNGRDRDLDLSSTSLDGISGEKRLYSILAGRIEHGKLDHGSVFYFYNKLVNHGKHIYLYVPASMNNGVAYIQGASGQKMYFSK